MAHPFSLPVMSAILLTFVVRLWHARVAGAALALALPSLTGRGLRARNSSRSVTPKLPAHQLLTSNYLCRATWSQPAKGRRRGYEVCDEKRQGRRIHQRKDLRRWLPFPKKWTGALARAAGLALPLVVSAFASIPCPALASSTSDTAVPPAILCSDLIPSWTIVTIRIFSAAALGALLGLARPRSSSPSHGGGGAGVRTMALVSLGACVFTLCGTHGFSSALSATAGAGGTPADLALRSLAATDSAGVDTSRMASTVATGVGFIGAGVITNNRMPDGTYDRESSKRGLTTAAAIWVSAAVGVAAGSGMVFAGLAFVLMAVAVLRYAKFFDGSYASNSDLPLSSSRRDSKPLSKDAAGLSAREHTEYVDDGVGDPAHSLPPIAPNMKGKGNGDGKNDLDSLSVAPTTMDVTTASVNKLVFPGKAESKTTKADMHAIENDTRPVPTAPSPEVVSGNTKEGKVPDPLLEKFLQRGGNLEETFSSTPTSPDIIADGLDEGIHEGDSSSDTFGPDDKDGRSNSADSQ